MPSSRFNNQRKGYKPKVCGSKPVPKPKYQYLLIRGSAVGTSICNPHFGILFFGGPSVFRRLGLDHYVITAPDSIGEIHHATIDTQGWDGFLVFQDDWTDPAGCHHTMKKVYNYDARYHTDTVVFDCDHDPEDGSTERVTLEITAKK